ncbi:hypothetical protein [Sphingopyxis sp.]|jgi:hypothetical protein|uniref:hypothetical protein n=1 Tax=Sphingopyxis sp. TaxID=1908224 RepID=UPI002E03B550|nr:hypothetical protein [Sphingopyxis sp.]
MPLNHRMTRFGGIYHSGLNWRLRLAVEEITLKHRFGNPFSAAKALNRKRRGQDYVHCRGSMLGMIGRR